MLGLKFNHLNKRGPWSLWLESRRRWINLCCRKMSLNLPSPLQLRLMFLQCTLHVDRELKSMMGLQGCCWFFILPLVHLHVEINYIKIRNKILKFGFYEYIHKWRKKSVLSRLRVLRPEMTLTFKDCIEDSKYLEIMACGISHCLMHRMEHDLHSDVKIDTDIFTLTCLLLFCISDTVWQIIDWFIGKSNIMTIL